ncbi:hypothetical protein OFAG_02144 [Oxalobacter formigenes HOxBLS]|uniref:Uncharacterized protein n=1 Tax=Oxalobacter paraformigenes TaxID=556268 RepID=T5LUZ7_9BURK|nr:hypothetical protein OFAG_02144 [Oxalobacter paraformigenes]
MANGHVSTDRFPGTCPGRQSALPPASPHFRAAGSKSPMQQPCRQNKQAFPSPFSACATIRENGTGITRFPASGTGPARKKADRPAPETATYNREPCRLPERHIRYHQSIMSERVFSNRAIVTCAPPCQDERKVRPKPDSRPMPFVMRH